MSIIERVKLEDNGCMNNISSTNGDMTLLAIGNINSIIGLMLFQVTSRGRGAENVKRLAVVFSKIFAHSVTHS